MNKLNCRYVVGKGGRYVVGKGGRYAVQPIHYYHNTWAWVALVMIWVNCQVSELVLLLSWYPKWQPRSTRPPRLLCAEYPYDVIVEESASLYIYSNVMKPNSDHIIYSSPGLCCFSFHLQCFSTSSRGKKQTKYFVKMLVSNMKCFSLK